MPRWTDLKVSGSAEAALNDLLDIKQRGSESYLINSQGRVLHSRMTLGTSIPATEDALAELR